ncbi:unnamed protein product [Vitrella brassicaformis CCMP3155]|uniref:RRM domain-containing protein n=2 Tax=Vitrella brassicaformis TaxID=1169539 RepID=A0A0G4ECM8_VITBC|nr:unnamed protein product [Vitrella brassicaformis CCMP3155]|eukprot:CEL93729.1 unnamed protein product [Vitrella brassicaformis CCMP3155]
MSGPMYNINALKKLNEQELSFGLEGEASWHHKYKNSSYVFIGGLDYGLTEGDVVMVFSQWGEPIDINLVRDKKTGKSKGFAFLAYEDQRSTVLAVDNGNGMELLHRKLRVDHVSSYRAPDKYDENDLDEEGNPKRLKYEASGAEGKGIGQYGVTEIEKILQDQAAAKAEAAAKEPAPTPFKDEDELWAMQFEKQLHQDDDMDEGLSALTDRQLKKKLKKEKKEKKDKKDKVKKEPKDKKDKRDKKDKDDRKANRRIKQEEAEEGEREDHHQDQGRGASPAWRERKGTTKPALRQRIDDDDEDARRGDERDDDRRRDRRPRDDRYDEDDDRSKRRRVDDIDRERDRDRNHRDDRRRERDYDDRRERGGGSDDDERNRERDSGRYNDRERERDRERGDRRDDRRAFDRGRDRETERDRRERDGFRRRKRDGSRERIGGRDRDRGGAYRDRERRRDRD